MNIPLCMNLKKAIQIFAKCDHEILYNRLNMTIHYNGHGHFIVNKEEEYNCFILEDCEILYICINVKDYGKHMQKQFVLIFNVRSKKSKYMDNDSEFHTYGCHPTLIFLNEPLKYYYVTIHENFVIKENLYNKIIDPIYKQLINPIILYKRFQLALDNNININLENNLTSIKKIVILYDIGNFLEQAINFKYEKFYYISSSKTKELFVTSKNNKFSFLKIKYDRELNQEPIIIDNRQHSNNLFFQVNAFTNQYKISLSKEMSSSELIMTIHTDPTLIKYKKLIISLFIAI